MRWWRSRRTPCGTDLGPQMNVVADLQHPGPAHLKDLIGHLAGIFAIAPRAVGNDGPDTDRIENRGDPGARQFAVMRQDGGFARRHL